MARYNSRIPIPIIRTCLTPSNIPPDSGEIKLVSPVDLAKLAAISSMGGSVTASPAPAWEEPAAWAADTVNISSTIPQKGLELIVSCP